ncbi:MULTISPECIES: Txe/YoeB family addiction module toxin [unclassified Fusibacter]|uniref:Txe/YoeB family addiction module toxin n=1 Tax=unclassified Fusibacter TaxID=2624464 RepID=UPI001010BA98|nr:MULTISPECIES: Txe/YoeB family addiction module toxin [unclassified Fusibacter]MCK8059035.1 Txe/YoeB family addiction module toxin [Fusibacter sp. A2]NPE22446.1 Txe/YoeB family addiction module toxin [Fusibacter sp. A1]RXV60550.1 Txe/YoeB family addiction module toxin [Fusibacter sp. A1]
MYTVVFTKKAIKDVNKLKAANLSEKAKKLVELLKENPYAIPPSYEKLVGDLSGAYSRRINIQHRLIYSIDEGSKTVKIIRMWTHYE